ncbi:MAG: hypothetical protein J0M10_04715 [Chitinophagales bacterium]|nr:hypothetical protein [Chitinophagales bacterium]
MKQFLPAVLLVSFFTSCTTANFIQHTPSLVQSGTHTEKGEFTGRALYSTGSSSSNTVENSTGASPYQQVRGFQAQGSYAVDDHFAVQGSFMHSGEKGGSTENGVKSIVYDYNRNVAEAGLAFYQALGDKSNFYFELGGGAGLGSYKAKELSSLLVPGGRYYDHSVFKLYVQPSFYFISPNVHVQTGFKFASVNFNNIKSNYTSLEKQSRDLTLEPKLNTTVIDFFFRTDIYLPGLPWLGFSGQTQVSSELQKKFNTNINDNNYGIGVCFRFGELTEQKAKKN